MNTNPQNLPITENSSHRKAYKIINNNNNFELVKILNEYTTEDEAFENLMELLSNKATEKAILKDYSNKKVF